MWTSIYVANSQKQADKIKMALEAEGILTHIRTSQVTTMNAEGLFEIQVLESEAEEAQGILCETVNLF